MNVGEIKDVLKEFADSNDKSLLIDGPWGCGKTHQIREFLKQQKRENIRQCFYMSLFGFNDIKTLNNELYTILHPIKIKTQKVINNVFKIATAGIKTFPIPGISGIADTIDAIGYSLGELNENKTKDNITSIIIFDDMERIGDKITYEELFGYISSLYMRGARFIGIVSSDNISNNKKDSFAAFREKVFDEYCVINTQSEEMIRDIFFSLGVTELEKQFASLIII